MRFFLQAATLSCALSFSTFASGIFPLPMPKSLQNPAAYALGSKINPLLTCNSLVHRGWGYPDGIAASLCDDAERACLRYGLFRDRLKRVKDGQIKMSALHLKTTKSAYKLSIDEVNVKLGACQIALDIATRVVIGLKTNNVIKAAGFSNPSSL